MTKLRRRDLLVGAGASLALGSEALAGKYSAIPGLVTMATTERKAPVE